GGAGLRGGGGAGQAGDVPVGDQLHAGAGLAYRGDQLGVARPVENASRDVGQRDAFRLRHGVERVAGRCVQIQDALRVAGPDGDLVHVHVGRIEQPASLGDGEHSQRVGHGLGADGGALQRIDGNIDLGTVANAQLLADVEHGTFVHLAFADHHAAFDVNLGELLAHGIDGGLVGGLLVATAPETGGGDGGGLGHSR